MKKRCKERAVTPNVGGWWSRGATMGDACGYWTDKRHRFRSYDEPGGRLSCRCGAEPTEPPPSLFDTPTTARARTTDPDTSREAAESVRDLRGSQQDVLKVLRRIGPATDAEILAAYGELAKSGFVRRQSVSGIRTRRSELVAYGYVRDSGRRQKLATGRNATVWVVAPEKYEEDESGLESRRRGDGNGADAV